MARSMQRLLYAGLAGTLFLSIAAVVSPGSLSRYLMKRRAR